MVEHGPGKAGKQRAGDRGILKLADEKDTG